MHQISTTILVTIAVFWLIGFCGFGVISYREGEKRAMRIAFILAACGFVIFILAALLPETIQQIFLAILTGTAVILLVLFFLPVRKVSMGNDTPARRVDERDIVFARARLKPGSPEYRSYYQARPENQEVDTRTRSKAGLLSPEAKLANPYLFASPEGSFWLTENLREAVNGPVAPTSQKLSPEKMTRYLKDLAFYYGALEVGVTKLHPYHVYSHIGRGTGTYGAPLDINHRYAIVMTVEMDFQMTGTSPEAQEVMETARQYVESARIAVQLAGAIRALGYPARAHIDGNYRVIAPLVARDAGLGEIGRIGLLITAQHGPRVRLGAVTTNAELIPDERRPDPSVIDFCNICTKCAESCPSKSIPQGDRQIVEGALRWKINAESCFLYWNVIGTDCGRCMAVCPYSHPNTISHNLIRWGSRRSGSFRRAANALDDLFYGKKPARRDAPAWTNITPEQP